MGFEKGHVMNFEELAENLGLEEDAFLELVELFLETSFSDLSKLLSAIDEENVKKVVEAAHSIKGAAENMGFMEMFKVAKGVEMKARDNGLEGVVESVEIIRNKLNVITDLTHHVS